MWSPWGWVTSAISTRFSPVSSSSVARSSRKESSESSQGVQTQLQGSTISPRPSPSTKRTMLPPLVFW